MTQRLCILGGNGYLGSNLARLLAPHFAHIDALAHAQLDILNHRTLLPALKHYAPDVLINAAGGKDLDWCQKNPTRACDINGIGAGNVAVACREAGIRLLHLSTDYAWQAKMMYGDSKALGEDLVRHECPTAAICRVSGVYAADAPWVRWLEGELRAGRKVSAWSNVYNTPLYVDDLAAMLLGEVKDGKGGLKRMAGPDRMSRYDLFTAYAGVFGYDAGLIERSTCDDPLVPLDVAQEVSHWMGASKARGVTAGLMAMRDGMQVEAVARDAVVEKAKLRKDMGVAGSFYVNLWPKETA